MQYCLMIGQFSYRPFHICNKYIIDIQFMSASVKFRLKDLKKKRASSLAQIYTKKFEQFRTETKDSTVTLNQKSDNKRKEKIFLCGSTSERPKTHSNFVNPRKRRNSINYRILIGKEEFSRKNNSAANRQKPSLSIKNKERGYKQIYKDFLSTINYDNNIELIQELDAENDVIQQLKLSKKRIDSQMQTTLSSFRRDLANRKMNQSIDEQLSEDYEFLASKTIPDKKQSPGQLIYQRFCLKYRDYNMLKQKQLETTQTKFKRFHRQQKKIFDDLKERGISEENQFRMISKIYSIYELLKGKKSEDNKKEYLQKINLKKLRSNKFSDDL